MIFPNTSQASKSVGWLARHALPALALVATMGANAQNTLPFSDDFNNRALNDPTIGNNWTWYDLAYTDAACSAGNEAGGYGPYSDGDGSDYVHGNQNFTNCDPDGGCYFRAGIVEPAAGNFALDVYGNQYSSSGDACSQVNIFQEFAATASGTYRLSANVQANPYVGIASTSRVGVFYKVLKASDTSYATLQYGKQTVSVPSSGTKAVTFEFTVDAANQGELLQVGFFNETTPASRDASAWWDDVAVAEVTPTSGGVGDNGGTAAVPTLPVTGLVILSLLAGWLGKRHLRRR